jgi:HTH-type transcriptional regulator, sugar sensing transcriptional regulator
MADAVELLQQLGFGEYEARAYRALLQRNPLNGYELAKLSGLPRANVYGVLRKLEERGAVVRLDTPDGARYGPVAPDELLQRLRSHFQVALDDARCTLGDITSPVEDQYVWNLRGYPVLLEHAAALIAGARRRLLVAVWPPEAHALAEPLAAAEARGVEITAHCLTGCAQPCGACRGHLYRYAVVPEPGKRWLVVIPDEAEVLAGEIDPASQTLATRSRQRLLVDLAAWYVRNSVALGTVVGGLGSRINDLLAPDARLALAAIAPESGDAGWLAGMRVLLPIEVVADAASGDET